MQYQRVELPTLEGGSIPMDMYIPHVSEAIDPHPRRTSVVIYPGGGYHFVSEREAEPVALRFAAAGFNTFVVWYRVAPQVHFPTPQQDAASAIAYVRAHAEELHCHPDRIAVLGFSAGGHLAGSMGVMWNREELWAPLGLTAQQVRPNAMVLCYPVITGGEYAHRGSFECLSGSENLSDHTPFSLETLVTEQTPPTFLWHTWDDGSVPVENTLLMAMALRRAGVQGEVHIFPHGSHGASLADVTTTAVGKPDKLLPDCAEWPGMAARFLRKVLG